MSKDKGSPEELLIKRVRSVNEKCRFGWNCTALETEIKSGKIENSALKVFIRNECYLGDAEGLYCSYLWRLIDAWMAGYVDVPESTESVPA